MTRYHLTPRGEPGECSATVGVCPYGSGDEHYPTPEEARSAYEEERKPELLPRGRSRRPAPTREAAIELDQFFTKDEVAVEALTTVEPLLRELGYDPASLEFVEPSAGGGSFLRAAAEVFPGRPVSAGDLLPQAPGVREMDFLAGDSEELFTGDRRQTVVIGNPPFGYQGSLAASFIDEALEHADTVVFVLPANFLKQKAQEKVRGEARLVHSEKLPSSTFLVNGTPYPINCCLQVWTKREGGNPDLRKRGRAPREHPDFDSWLVTSRPASRRHIEEADWDYAVTAQGFKGNFQLLRRSDQPELSPKRQYMLLKPNTPEARAFFEATDFEELAAWSTTRVKGFGKADLVEAYVEASGKISA